MAGKKGAAGVAALNMALLSSIVVATRAGSFVYVSDQHNEPFLKYKDGPLVVVDPGNVRDAAGNIATKSTDLGNKVIDDAAASAGSGSGNTAGTTTERPKFNIVAVDLGEKPKRGRGPIEAKWPFDDLPEPSPEQANRKQWPSFFVPATDEMADPAKSLASTVNGAMKRYATQTGEKEITRAKRGEGRGAKAVRDEAGNVVKETVKVPTYNFTRKFTVYRIEDGAPWGFPGQKGAAIARTA